MTLCSVCDERPVRYVKTRECPRCYNRRYVAANRESVQAAKNAWQRRTRGMTDRTAEMPSFDLTAPVAYSTAHGRVANWRGKASLHGCEHCGQPAREWAYRGGSPHEQVAEIPTFASRDRTVAGYSPDPMDYVPLCRSCHVKHDVALAKE